MQNWHISFPKIYLLGNPKVTYIYVTFKLPIMQQEVKQVWHFSQSPEEVWEYLTKPELIEQWLTQTDFQPTVGHKFRFINKSGKIVYCEVLDVNPFTRLSYTWQFPSATDGKRCDSTIVWTLTPKGQGTELQLVHNGFVTTEDLVGHTKGWNTCLQRFTELIQQTNHANTKL